MRTLATILCAAVLAVAPASATLRSISPMMGDGVPRAAGPKGDPGVDGQKGDPGAVGNTGPVGPAGRDGVDGQRGPAGADGKAGKDGQSIVGPQGPMGPAGANGAAGASVVGPQGPAGASITGPQGPTGPKASTFVCNATLTEAIPIGASSGTRVSPEATCAGVLTTDILVAYPTSLASLTNGLGVSNGFAVHHVLPSKAGAVKAILMIPPITILTTYTIPVAVYAVNR